jgi:threonine synthase
VLQKAESGVCYASHAWLPFGMLGIATIAYEIFEQAGTFPGMIIAPVGHGSGLLGIARGFKALSNLGTGKKMPILIGVQSNACNPVERAYYHQESRNACGDDVHTLAEGVKVANPARLKPLISVIRESGGDVVSIPESEILPSRNTLAKRGLYVEPTSALVWAALQRITPPVNGPIVLILTGSGLKYPGR